MDYIETVSHSTFEKTPLEFEFLLIFQLTLQPFKPFCTLCVQCKLYLYQLLHERVFSETLCAVDPALPLSAERNVQRDNIHKSVGG